MLYQIFTCNTESNHQCPQIPLGIDIISKKLLPGFHSELDSKPQILQKLGKHYLSYYSLLSALVSSNYCYTVNFL